MAETPTSSPHIRPLDQRILDHWLFDRVMGWITVGFIAFGLSLVVALLLVPLVILIVILIVVLT